MQLCINLQTGLFALRHHNDAQSSNMPVWLAMHHQLENLALNMINYSCDRLPLYKVLQIFQYPKLKIFEILCTSPLSHFSSPKLPPNLPNSANALQDFDQLQLLSICNYHDENMMPPSQGRQLGYTHNWHERHIHASIYQ